MKNSNLNMFLAIGVFVLLGILLFNSFYVFSIGKSLNAKIEEAKELARPAKIDIIKLESSCADCFDISKIAKVLKESADLKIVSEKSLPRNSKAAKEMIEKYDIKRLPTILLKGEIGKPSIQNFKKVNDALVFDAVSPPYEDAAAKKIVGKVSAVVISDKSCKACANLSLLVQNLRQNGVFAGKEEKFDFSETKAKNLISKYAIKKLPVLLLSDDLDAYPEISQSIAQMGHKAENYYLVESQAPYVEAESGKLRGLAKLSLLNDSSCKECYNVNVHKSILARFGIAIDEEKGIDASSAEGKQLIGKYGIKNVPTIVLTGDLNIYENFNNVWKQVGTVETDGTYIFREMSAMGPNIVYKDTATNEVKKIEPQSAPAGQQ